MPAVSEGRLRKTFPDLQGFLRVASDGCGSLRSPCANLKTGNGASRSWVRIPPPPPGCRGSGTHLGRMQRGVGVTLPLASCVNTPSSHVIAFPAHPVLGPNIAISMALPRRCPSCHYGQLADGEAGALTEGDRRATFAQRAARPAMSDMSGAACSPCPAAFAGRRSRRRPPRAPKANA